jgi:hypothetical protein
MRQVELGHQLGVSSTNGPEDIITYGNIINYIPTSPVIGIRTRATAAGDPVGCEVFSNNLFHYFHAKGDTADGNGFFNWGNYRGSNVNNLPLDRLLIFDFAYLDPVDSRWKSLQDIGIDGADDSSGSGGWAYLFFGGGYEGIASGGCGNSPDIPLQCRDFGSSMGQVWKTVPGLNAIPAGKTIRFRTVGSSDSGQIQVTCEYEVLLGTPVY